MRKFKLKADDMMFTSDTHFGHANIIKYCSRPFNDVADMDAQMIERWNAAVRPDQTVFHVGDFAICSPLKVPRYLEQLNGKVILVRGNHDHTKSLKHFPEVHDLVEVKVGSQTIVLFHYAMTVWNGSHKGSWHLHGHSHGTLPDRMDQKVLDIGADSWGWTPVSLAQIARAMESHGTETVDHHGTRRGRD